MITVNNSIVIILVDASGDPFGNTGTIVGLSRNRVPSFQLKG
jgi:hypothetical protein